MLNLKDSKVNVISLLKPVYEGCMTYTTILLFQTKFPTKHLGHKGLADILAFAVGQHVDACNHWLREASDILTLYRAVWLEL